MTRQFLHYGIAGLINTGLGFATYSISILVFQLDYRIASFFTTIVGITAGFLQSRHAVFKSGSRGSTWRYLALFAGLYFGSIILIGGLLQMGLTEIEAYIAMLPIVIPLSFIVQKYWVFYEKP